MSDTATRPEAPPPAVNRPGLICLLIVALALRLVIVWQPLDWLVTHTMPDDAFYYFQIARHVAVGNGVTFDGAELTNGFHPLWMGLLAPLFAVFSPNGELGVHLGLTLAAVLDAITMLLLVRLVARVTDVGAAGLAAGAWYALNPGVLTHIANGLETAVNLLCLTGLFAFAVRGWRECEPRVRWWVGFGLVAGVTMLARSDNVVPVVVVGAGLCLVPWRPRRARGLALSAGIAALLVVPWLWWNWRTFGRVLQTSAGAYSVVTRGNLASQGFGPWTVVWYAIRDTYTLLVRTIPLDLVGESKIVGILVGTTAVLLATKGAGRVGASARQLALPTLATLALLFANSLGRGTIKVWYVAPAALMLACAAGLVWQAIALGDGSRKAKRWAGGLVCITVVTGFVLNGATVLRRGMYPWQAELLAGGRWLARHTPPDTVAGSFNSGLIGYVADRVVVNLDGLVNTSAADAVRDRRLGAYIEARGITVLVDNAYTLFQDYARFYGPEWSPRGRLRLVEEFALPRGAWAGHHVGAYRVVADATASTPGGD